MDSHRSPAFVISPYVKRHTVDSSMYNTTSMLRTIELMLGLRPMTQFDAAARPMTAVFPGDRRPRALHRREAAHSARRAQSADAPGAAASTDMNFDEADENDDDELNDILWRAIRKASPPPPPGARATFGEVAAAQAEACATEIPDAANSICASSGTCTSRSIRTWSPASTNCPGPACTRSRTTTAWCAILEEFPKVRQTFNLVPSMMVQVAEYAAGEAADPFLQLALKPAEEPDRCGPAPSCCTTPSTPIRRA